MDGDLTFTHVSVDSSQTVATRAPQILHPIYILNTMMRNYNYKYGRLIKILRVVQSGIVPV